MDADRIVGAGKDFAGTVRESLGAATGDRAEPLKGALSQASGLAQDAYGQAKDTVRNAAGAAPDLADTARRGYREGNQSVARAVGDHHLAAVLIAGAIGYAFGWLIHSRD